MNHPKDPPRSVPRRYGRGRRLAFRAAAVLLGLGFVVLLEVTFRSVGWGRIEDLGDPFVGFSDVLPLFELDEASDQFRIANTRLNWFQPDSFSAHKSPREFRIFCLGGSTVQGRPYSIETSFTTWLELSLQAAAPETDWQVVNCGGVSYASYRLLPILREVLQYEPNLLIIYTGHNEFLEDRTYGEVKQRPRWVVGLQERLMQWRIYGVTRQLLLPAAPPRQPISTLPAEVDALLDYQGGLAKYHRDDEWRAGVIQHFDANLRRMVRIARNADVPILFANPVANVRDTPPFKVELDPGLSADQRQQFEHVWAEARDAGWENLAAKAALVERVLQMDRRHANALFLLAKIREAEGDLVAAKRAYLQAKDEDICPLRMLEPMHRALKEICQQINVPLIDVRATFEAEAEHGIPGDDQLIDHVHPRIAGHQRMARQLVDYMVAEGIVTPVANWEATQKELYKANFASLPANYFPESLARLRGLQTWAAGRVTRLKLDD